MAAIAAGLAYACVNLFETGKFVATSNASLDFSLENCSLLIRDHNDASISQPIYVKYRVPQDLSNDETTTMSIQSDQSPQKLEIKNGLESRYCQVQLFVKKGTPLQSLNINCPRCNITQDNSFQLEVTGALRIQGDAANANFRNLKVGSITYQALTGYLQLSNIDASSTANVFNLSIEGDIIIQSTQNFQVDVSTETQAFCFKAPFVEASGTPQNCAISGDSKIFFYSSFLTF